MSKRKLLLADDSITIQKVVNLTFADEGIEVVAVGDGDSAMRKFEEFIPDLVMADVNMPGLTGYEMCQIIKNNEETQRIPVILLVGSFEPFDETKAQEVGADDYLTKPFQSIRQLVNKVTDLLSKTEESAAIEPAAVEAEPASSEAVSSLSAASSVAAAPPDTFAETLEMPRAENFRTDFGDAGMDDEMIETSRADYFSPPAITDFQKETEAPADAAPAHPLTAEDLKPFNFSENRSFPEQDLPIEDESPESVATPQDFAREQTNEDFSRREIEREEYAQNVEAAPSSEFSESIEDGNGEADIEPPRQFSGSEEFTAQQKMDAETAVAPSAEPETVYHSSAGESLETQNAQYESQAAEREEAAAENLGAADAGFEQSRTESSEADRFEPIESFESTEQFGSTDRQEQFGQVEQIDASERYEASEDFQSGNRFDAGEDFQTGGQIEQTEQFDPSDRAASDEAREISSSFEERAPETENLSRAEPAETTAAQSDAGQTEEFVGAREEAPAEIEPEEIRQSEIATAEKIPVVSFDDDDMLELPPLVEETGIRPQPKPEPPVAEPEPVEAPPVEVAPPPALTIPPEVIESIVQKLAEKISGQVSERISGQVSEMIAAQMPQIAPQVSEMIVEELTKDHEVREPEASERENNE